MRFAPENAETYARHGCRGVLQFRRIPAGSPARPASSIPFAALVLRSMLEMWELTVFSLSTSAVGDLVVRPARHEVGENLVFPWGEAGYPLTMGSRRGQVDPSGAGQPLHAIEQGAGAETPALLGGLTQRARGRVTIPPRPTQIGLGGSVSGVRRLPRQAGLAEQPGRIHPFGAIVGPAPGSPAFGGVPLTKAVQLSSVERRHHVIGGEDGRLLGRAVGRRRVFLLQAAQLLLDRRRALPPTPAPAAADRRARGPRAAPATHTSWGRAPGPCSASSAVWAASSG